MTANRRARRHGRSTGFLMAVTMLLGSMPAGASNGLDTDCPSLLAQIDAAALPAPVLHIELTDLAVPSAPDRADSDVVLRELPAMTSRQSVDALLEDVDPATDDGNRAAEREQPALPPTATSLPGVDDEDLPRFRRQMFRTDI